MLNYDNILSVLNSQKTSERKLSSIIGIPYSTLHSRLTRRNLTPNDIEKIAAFYKKPIAYFFDKTEDEIEKMSLDCKECKKKDKKIEQLEKQINGLTKKLAEIQDSYIQLLEHTQDLGKKCG